MWIFVVRSDIDTDSEPVFDISNPPAAFANHRRDIVVVDVDDRSVLIFQIHIDVAAGDRPDFPFNLLFGNAVDTGFLVVFLEQWDGDDLSVERIDFVFGFAGFELRDEDDWTGEVLFGESCGDLHLGFHVVHLRDFPGFDVDNGVDDLGNHPQLDASNKSLQGIDRSGGVNDTDHADSRKAHVGKHLEIVRFADLVVDGVIRSHHQKGVSRLLHLATEFGILGDFGTDL